MKAKLKFSSVLAGVFLASGVIASDVKADEVEQSSGNESVTNEEVVLENEVSTLNSTEDDKSTLSNVYLDSTTFPDNNFRSLLADELGVSDGADITALLSRTELTISGESNTISNITGIEKFTNLETLEITGLKATSSVDVSPINDLTNITSLSLSLYTLDINGVMEKLTSLVDLTNLHLESSYSTIYITDTSMLGNFSNLEDLTISTSGTYVDICFNESNAISNLENLTSLEISTLGRHGNIYFEAENAISNLENLTSLEISTLESYGYIYFNESNTISNLESLTSLEISTSGNYGRIYLSASNAISSLPSLTSLEISTSGEYGDIYFEAENAISNLENLTSLEISTSGYSGRIYFEAENAISNLENLTSLEISTSDPGGSIYLRASNAISNLPSLTSLEISISEDSGRIYFEAENAISNLESLTSLEISTSGNWGYIYFNASNAISNLPSLTSLEISTSGKYGYIYFKAENAISNLESLTSLTISIKGSSSYIYDENNTKLTDLSGYIDVFPKLEYLDLSNNYLSDLSYLENYETLHYLDISGNDMTSLESLKNLKIIESDKFSDDGSSKIGEVYLYGNNIDLEEYKYLPRNYNTSSVYMLVSDANIDLNDYAPDDFIFYEDEDGTKLKTDWSEVYTDDDYALDYTISYVGEVETTDGIDGETGDDEDSNTSVDDSESSINEEDDSESSINEEDDNYDNTVDTITKSENNGDGTVIFSSTNKSSNTESSTTSESHWAESYIADLYEKRILTDTEFNPDVKASRGEVAILVYNLLKYLGVDVEGFESAEFIDVVESSYYYDEVELVNYLDVMVGYGDETFKPENNITREEFVMVLYKLISKGYVTLDETTSREFTDYDEISWWCKDAFDYVNKTGLITGYTDGTFNPQGNLTRAEVITFLYKILN